MSNNNDMEKRLDWNIILSAIGIVVSVSAVIIGCYISISTRLTRIETVLIMQKIMPNEFAAHERGK